MRGEGETSHVCEALSTILGSERMLYKQDHYSDGDTPGQHFPQTQTHWSTTGALPSQRIHFSRATSSCGTRIEQGRRMS